MHQQAPAKGGWADRARGENMGTTIEVRELDDIPILVVIGKMDHSSIVAIKNIISSWLDKGRYRIVLDLGDAEGMCYVGISTLVGGLRMLRNVSGDIKLVRLRTAMREAFRTVGIEGLFEDFDSAEEAVESYYAGDRCGHQVQAGGAL